MIKFRNPAGIIPVVIVEDEKEVRDGLQYLLNLDKQIKVISTYSSGEELLEGLKSLKKPLIILMDLGLPGISGIETTRRVKETYPEIDILILTIFEDEKKILDSIRCGATGYLLKNTKPDLLLDQIKSVHSGGSPISPTVARRILDEIKKENPSSKSKDYNLTPKEKEILKDIVDGLTYKEIGERHFIAGSTARKHILHIYQKLNVTSKAEFVKKAIKENLV